MHVATVLEFSDRLIPAVAALTGAIRTKAREWAAVVKIGRTHLQDATPLTVGQEWSGYAAQLDDALALVKQSVKGLYRLAAGGTAVGTGINAPPDFGEKVAAEITRLTGLARSRTKPAQVISNLHQCNGQCPQSGAGCHHGIERALSGKFIRCRDER